MDYSIIKQQDPEIYQAIEQELNRQQSKIELIASENFVSPAVMAAQGSILTNKYAEGYPSKRYYGGCEYVDIVENLAIERCKQLFGAEHVNVQPHSGTQANTAVYFAMLEPGDTILGMDLAHGGHLTHGMRINISGKYFQSVGYQVEEDSYLLDYDKLKAQALEIRPKMIVAGASAYARTLDFAKFREIADACGAYLLVDMAHIAGLVAAGIHPSPIPYADFVTTTTHKTLRGPRGGVIMCKAEYAKKINSAIFPGIQGGPLMHVIAAKAIAFKEALSPEFKNYQQQVVDNARALAKGLMQQGIKIITDGTDNHIVLVDLRGTGCTGKVMQERLDEVNITCNKNGIPFDTEKPTITSGLRLGTPAVTTRGFDEADMQEISELIAMTLNNYDKVAEIKARVDKLCQKYPLYAR